MPLARISLAIVLGSVVLCGPGGAESVPAFAREHSGALSPSREALWRTAVALAEAGRRDGQVKATKAAIADVAWIAGGWTGSTGPVSVEERWTTPAGGAMLAVSRTVRDSKMIAFEFLRIVERNGTLLYIAQPNGRPPTEFTLTAFDAQSATFENPSHDFPKKVRYAKRADGGLDATVSGDGGKAETFQFKREAR